MSNLENLQKEYNRMVKLAESSDYDLTPEFEKELVRLTKAVKALGGRV